MKYAFTGRKNGIISVSARLDGALVRMAIADNGNGMPLSVDFENSTGFGLVLVAGLVKQICGTIRIERVEGTRIILEFEK
jgi:two-component sensor histidine kinase